MGAALIRGIRRTELIGAFRCLCERSKKLSYKDVGKVLRGTVRRKFMYCSLGSCCHHPRSAAILSIFTGPTASIQYSALDKVTFAQLVKKFLAFYGKPRSLVLPTLRHWSVWRVRGVQSTFCLIFFLILSYLLQLIQP
jgi:hypothetical protein